MLKSAIAAVGLMSLLFTSSLSANDDWPYWRGPNRNDQSNETGLLQSWPEGGPERVWVNDSAGLGYAGFSVVGGRLFTMGLEDDQEFALCLDAATGVEVWRTPIGDRFKNGWGDGPRSTPTVDGDRVYFMAARGDLVCLSTDMGQKVWSIRMQDFGGKIPVWGYSESPLVDGDLVLCTPGGKQGTVLAVDRKTGKKVWQSAAISYEDSEGKQVGPPPAHYSSVLPIELDGQKQYVQLTQIAVIGLNPENGETLWQVPFPGRVAVIPSPLFVDGQVYVTAGYGVGSKLIELGKEGAKEVWYQKAMQNHHGGVIQLNGHIYGSSSKSFVCQSLADGEMKWSERGIKKGCVAYADGRFYHVQETDGLVLLIKADENGSSIEGSFVLDPQTERRNPKGKIWVHPVISDGKLYLRDQEFIHCYNIRK